jgi:hypothetical protein
MSKYVQSKDRTPSMCWWWWKTSDSGPVWKVYDVTSHRPTDRPIDRSIDQSINQPTNQQCLLVRSVIAVKGSVTDENFLTG